ncbi:MAG: hypothetical protein IPO98_06915 [Saprospiraceae bacterium]|nr:hypothetical protein [Saprospiraceae bacterium]
MNSTILKNVATYCPRPNRPILLYRPCGRVIMMAKKEYMHKIIKAYIKSEELIIFIFNLFSVLAKKANKIKIVSGIKPN